MKQQLFLCLLGSSLVSCIDVTMPPQTNRGNVTGPTGRTWNTGSQGYAGNQNQSGRNIAREKAEAIQLFREADVTNGGDGQLSFYECEYVADEWGENHHDLWADYLRSDWNGNGQISEREFLAAEGF